MNVKHNVTESELEVQRGGGCLGAIGIAFALWMAMLGSGLVVGWRAGDFSMGEMLGAGTLVCAFILCGLGVGTYRERFRFDAVRESLTQTRQLLFVTYLRREWPICDFEAVELFWNCRNVNNANRWFQVIRLLPAKEGAGPPERLELGSGKAGTMRARAQAIADFCNLPLQEPPKGEW